MGPNVRPTTKKKASFSSHGTSKGGCGNSANIIAESAIAFRRVNACRSMTWPYPQMPTCSHNGEIAAPVTTARMTSAGGTASIWSAADGRGDVRRRDGRAARSGSGGVLPAGDARRGDRSDHGVERRLTEWHTAPTFWRDVNRSSAVLSHLFYPAGEAIDGELCFTRL